MKKLQVKKLNFAITLAALLLSFALSAQVDGWNPGLENDAEWAMGSLLGKEPKLEIFKDRAYGYAIFPKVTKAAIGIGGAAGNGIVYEQDEVVGKAHLKQATVGIQFGGQQYIEVIFFENRETFENFTNGKLKFDAQASAVALKSGASVDAAYQDGVAVFTMTKGGIMYEASLGGQHFKYRPKAESASK